ncbi:unnamed protein product (mitochondrion) [Plasmodiophora brassicae]|uniref:Speckle targeted PIP5K1A-regulated poly(A) polymerase n=1 Tax=Plasmodiophora brassicae TaxID=37360 RepID=A0A3P3YMF7_PLABS|nr:unnamed protein product [Plasmodiophora brassicae]
MDALVNGVAVLGVGDGDQRVARPHPLSVEVEADGEHPTSAAASGTQVNAVFVRPLPATADETTVRSLFVDVADRIVGVDIRQGRLLRKKDRAFAIVTFSDPASVERALANDKRELGDLVVRLRIAKDDAALKMERRNRVLESRKKRPAVVHCSRESVVAALPAVSVSVDSWYATVRPKQETIDKRSEVITLLTRILADGFTRKALREAEGREFGLHLELFGSVPCNLSSDRSDLDIALIGDVTNPEAVLRAWYKVLKKRRLGITRLISGARVPVVKFQHRQLQLECDFTLKNDSDSQRSKTWLLRAYAEKDPRVPQLIAAVKFWSKARFIGDASKGSLNSFGYTLLVLYFLQHCSPPVIPNAQAMASSDEVAQATKNSPNPFLSSPFTSWRTDNTDSIGGLLYSFFKFYSIECSPTRQAICISTGEARTLPEAAEDRIAMFHDFQHFNYCIIDPFDKRDNVGRNVSMEIAVRIEDEFRRAYDLLSTCQPWEKVVEPVKRRQPKPPPSKRKDAANKELATPKGRSKTRHGEKSENPSSTDQKEDDTSEEAVASRGPVNAVMRKKRPKPARAQPPSANGAMTTAPPNDGMETLLLLLLQQTLESEIVIAGVRKRTVLRNKQTHLNLSPKSDARERLPPTTHDEGMP